MNARTFLQVLRKLWWLVLACVLAGIAAGAAFAAAQPVLYRSTSSVYVSANGGATQSDLLQGSTFTQNAVQSYVQLATMPVVLNPVVEGLRLNESAGSLAKRISADVQLNTVIIQVTASDRDPKRAADIANAVRASLADAARTLSAGSGTKPAITMRTVATAGVPSTPYTPNVPLLVLLGALLGLAAGLLATWLRGALDTRITSQEQLRAAVGADDAPFLGAVSHRRRGSAGPAVIAEPQGTIAEEYRRLLINLDFAGIDSRVRAVTVTSALSGEGKTTTSLNLAAAAAEAGQRVLLIDGDLRRPSVATNLGIDGGVGVTDVLLGRAEVGQAIQRVGELDVLPAGTQPPNVTQLVGSTALAKLVRGLIEDYDFVVVDAPPLLPVVDPLTLSKLTDGALVVARARETRRPQFAHALEALRLVDARILGVVLNDVGRTKVTGYGYEARDGHQRSLPVAVPEHGRRRPDAVAARQGS